MKKVKKIGILSFSKFLAFLGFLIGLVCGILYAFGGLVIDILVSLDWVYTTETPGLSYGTILAFGALIGMPLIFTVTGFLLGIIGALLYNLSTNWFSGINIDFK